MLKAKLDSGADNSSLDLDFASGLRVAGYVNISNSLGKSKRTPYALMDIVLPDPIGTRQIRVNLADRSHLRTPLLLGRSALQGVLIDPCI